MTDFTPNFDACRAMPASWRRTRGKIRFGRDVVAMRKMLFAERPKAYGHALKNSPDDKIRITPPARLDVYVTKENPVTIALPFPKTRFDLVKAAWALNRAGLVSNLAAGWVGRWSGHTWGAYDFSTYMGNSGAARELGALTYQPHKHKDWLRSPRCYWIGGRWPHLGKHSNKRIRRLWMLDVEMILAFMAQPEWWTRPNKVRATKAGGWFKCNVRNVRREIELFLRLQQGIASTPIGGMTKAECAVWARIIQIRLPKEAWELCRKVGAEPRFLAGGKAMPFDLDALVLHSPNPSKPPNLRRVLERPIS